LVKMATEKQNIKWEMIIVGVLILALVGSGLFWHSSRARLDTPISSPPTALVGTGTEASPSSLSDDLPSSAPTCVRAGCSGQLCVEANLATDGLVTTCEWSDAYACYQAASCELQPSGRCGFTPSEQLQQCLGVGELSIPDDDLLNSSQNHESLVVPSTR
jgi:hypothetical protein